MASAAAIALIIYLAAALVLVGEGLAARPEPADAAVVFGNQVHPDGQPSERLVARLSKALELYRAGRVRVIIVSGGLGREGYHEDEVMRAWLIRQGVPTASVICDGAGVNTAATARNTAAIMRAGGLRTAIAVTQYFHVPRARLSLELAGVKEVGGAYPRFVEWRDVYSIAREVPAVLKYSIQ